MSQEDSLQPEVAIATQLKVPSEEPQEETNEGLSPYVQGIREDAQREQALNAWKKEKKFFTSQELRDFKTRLRSNMMGEATEGTIKVEEAVPLAERETPPQVSELSELDQPKLDLDPNASLLEMQSYLVDKSKAALEMPSFADRNKQMAKAVGEESALLTVKSVGAAESLEKMTEVFTNANLDAGNTFSAAFDASGEKLPEQEAAFKLAMKEAGAAAYKHLPEALDLIQSKVDINDVLRRADFMDILRVTAQELGQAFPEGLTPDSIKSSLHVTAAGDYFESGIDTLPFSNALPLDPEEVTALDIAVRLANSTWKTGQVHRAKWEGNDGRINPNVREVFNPYDHLKKVQFDRLISEGKSVSEALVRVAFEVYKDKIQYDSLLPAVSVEAPVPQAA